MRCFGRNIRSILLAQTLKLALKLALALAVAVPAVVHSQTPFPDFKAKRIKPPQPGGGNRITIQVTAEDMERQRGRLVVGADPVAEIATKDPVAARAASFAWFWDSVSADIADTGPGRLRPALERLANPPDGAATYAPRLQAMQDIAKLRGVDILRATIGTDVSPALVLAVITVESAGRADAVSGAGAKGLMQLMPATAQRFGVSDALQPGDNIQGGVAFLDFLMKKFDRDPILVLAGYNAGENAVTKHAGVPPFVETRDYVPKVLAAYGVARGLCKTPPELITDGCVFHIM